MSIDLNVDLGEGGTNDEALMQLATSVNIACGGHAGGGELMRTTVEQAERHNLCIGAHPGYKDRENFGRRELELPPKELSDLVARQVAALYTLADIHHVKPHGALYNQAHRDPAVAKAVVEGISSILPPTLIYTLPGGALFQEAAKAGHTPIAEGFIDRTYQANGQLTPRSEPDAVISDLSQAFEQSLKLAHSGTVRTLCTHGDSPEALELLRHVRCSLEEAGLTFRAPQL